MSHLEDRIGRRLAQTVPPAIETICAEMHARFGAAVLAVLYYGSCLRQGDARDGVADVYVIVSSYAAAYPRWKTRLLARILPPTVGYLQTETTAGTVRAKYSVITLGDFRRGTSKRWFHSYLWGRFAQPCALAYVRDAATRESLCTSLGVAVGTLLDRTLPLTPARIQPVDLWVLALDLSYATELRPESTGRARELVAADREYYTGVLEDLVGTARLRWVTHAGGDNYAVAVPRWRRLTGRVAWRTRRVSGKLLSVLRWLKALGTFEGGLDYAVWKLERHSGTRIVLSEKTRRRPWLHVWGELFRLYRRGVLR